MTGNHRHASGARDGEGHGLSGTLTTSMAVSEQARSHVQTLTDRFAEHMQQGLMAASVELGLEVLAELLSDEVAGLAGPRGKHDPARTHLRHGTERGSVVLGGRRVQIQRPRVRTADDRAEASLGSYTLARATDLLTEHTVAAMLAGLSTRRYDAALEPVGTAAAQRSAGTSRSSVSRRFVAATEARLRALMSRRLDDERWLIVFIDGFGFAGHTLVGALGVTADGHKLPLAVVEGSTENKTLATRLVANLRDRGLDASRGVLFVIDGSQALAAAVAAVFGGHAVLARCRLHKERNVLDHLPEAKHAWVRRQLRAAWAQHDADVAKRELQALARALQREHPGAAASLREGLEETLTVTRLGVRGPLLKTVFSTNPIESMIEIVREHASTVKRWRDGEMVLRWAAAGMECARAQFRRVKGYRQLPRLAAALEAATAEEPGLLDLRASA
jgi:putative transposase